MLQQWMALYALLLENFEKWLEATVFLFSVLDGKKSKSNEGARQKTTLKKTKL